MLGTHVNEWKHRFNLHFHPKSIHYDNELVNFHKKTLLITVAYYLSKTKSLSEQKRIWFLDSTEEYTHISVKQLTQWITNSKTIFKTMKNYKNNNRKITWYFERKKLPEKIIRIIMR